MLPDRRGGRGLSLLSVASVPLVVNGSGGKLAVEMHKIAKLASQLYPEKFADPGDMSEECKSYLATLTKEASGSVVVVVEPLTEPLVASTLPVTEVVKTVEVISDEAWSQVSLLLNEVRQEVTKLSDQFYAVTGKET